MKLYIRKRRLFMSGPKKWVWWCGQEPEGPRCTVMRGDGWHEFRLALTDAFQHAYDHHGVILGDPLSDEEVEWGWAR